MNFLILGGSFVSLNIAGYLSKKAGNYVWDKMFPTRSETNYEKILKALEEVQEENRVWSDLVEEMDIDFEDITIIEKRINKNQI